MDNRNLIAAIVVSVAIIAGFQFFWEAPRREAMQAETAQQQAGEQSARPSAPEQAPGPAGTAPVAAGGALGVADRSQALAQTPRVAVDTPLLKGSIALRGGRVDDLVLREYHVTTDPASPLIELLSPVGSSHPYFVEVGWIPAGGQEVAVPGPDSLWTADGETLTRQTPVTMTWDNGEGLVFTRRLSLGSDYLFTIEQRVENTGTASVTLYPYGLVSRWGTPVTESMYILHEGAIGATDGVLQEADYDDLKDDGVIGFEGQGGWVGITDKYWLVALIPGQDQRLKAQFRHLGGAGTDKYQTEYVALEPRTVAPGGSVELSGHLFAGAKVVRLLDSYSEELGAERFDRAVGFRWLYFLAKPMFYLLDFFYGVVGNFGVAILLLTVLIKLLFFPLANKSYRAMGRMKALAPKMQELREKYAEDKPKLQQEMMELYKREKANPMAGCWPMLVQIPVFFALYEVLYNTIEMRHAPFFGWINDLSAPDPTSVFNLFGLIPWTPPDLLMIGGWPLIMGLTMWAQMKLNPAPPDPMQARIMMMLPVIFTFILASFPSGLVIYWAWNNALSIVQQWVIMKREGAHPTTPPPPKPKAKAKS